jgi:PAS domain S-box-containing protein
MPLRQYDLAKFPSMLTGWVSIVIGAAVMALWIARPGDLAVAAPILFSMQFNTALCFVLTGSAMCLSQSNAPRLSIGAAGLAALFAAATLAEYVFDVDLNIDQLFIKPFVTVGTNLAGRMAPNTALCFLLINTAILVSGALGRPSQIRIVLAAAVFMISTSALLGYLLSITTAHEWLPLARMSPQTAFCFVGLSTGLIFAGRLGYHPPVVAATLAAATYFLLLSLTYVELLRHEVLFTEDLPAAAHSKARSTLLAVLLLSGAVYAGLIVYAFRSSERSRKMTIQLDVSRKRLASIIDTAVDGFITIDDCGTILSVNPACEAIFGYAADEMTGRNIKMLMPSPYHDQHDQYLANYRKTGEAKVIGVGREAEGQRKDGTTFPVDLSVARIDLDHQVLYSGVVRDISKRKQYEREILEANAELEEFAYRTSHDLRSPIASSLGLIWITHDMIRQGASVAELEPILTRIEQSFRKLDNLIQNIIFLTRTKILEEQESTIAVARAVRETVDRLRPMDGGRLSTVHIDIPDTMVVHKKASRFQIILDNLLSNAINYHDPAVQVPEIFVQASNVKGRFVLSVADNGLGIPPADEPKLFQMFKRFHPQHAQGSGLGLYILRKSVEHLGGTVVYRRQDKGSIFTVTLPEENRR